jgi:methylthioribose-1-phosphate isomerase
MIPHIYWKDGALFVLDQRLLPFKSVYIKCTTLKDIARVIRNMTVRGAPLIGIVAAYGIVVAFAQTIRSKGTVSDRDAKRICRTLKGTRPTAVNLFWALNKMRQAYDACKTESNLISSLLETASKIHSDDIENNKKLGQYGCKLIQDGETILTHCNAGALATGGYGTALGVIRAAFECGKNIKVIATETRPYFQGARLTAWELENLGIDVTLVPDNHTGLLCEQGLVNRVIVGADRIAANGDTANKIGTYMHALAAYQAGIPFHIAAPLSTFDRNIKSGREIVIEERDGKEVRYVNKRLITGASIKAKYFGFDVTPARLITSIITEKGIIEKPFTKNIKTAFSEGAREYDNITV